MRLKLAHGLLIAAVALNAVALTACHSHGGEEPPPAATNAPPPPPPPPPPPAPPPDSDNQHRSAP